MGPRQRAATRLCTLFWRTSLFFRLDELTFPVYQQIILSHEAVKMHPIVHYMFSREMLDKWVVEEWGKILDMGYVDGVLLDRVGRHTENATKLLELLAAEAFGDVATDADSSKSPSAATTKKPRKRMVTVPKPFNLHKPSPAKLPEPIRIEAKIALRPVPQTTYRNSLSKIEQEKLDRKEAVAAETAAKYPASLEFKLAESKVDMDALRAEAREKEVEELQNQFRAKSAPDFSSKPAQVRMTAAAIMREDALYRAKQAKEAAVLKQYEADLRDSSQFYQWKTQMERDDELAKLARVDELREDMKASAQRAADAMEKETQMKRDSAVQHREEATIRAEKLAEELEEERRKKAELAAAVKEVQFEAPKRAAEALLAEKVKKTEEQREELAEKRRLRALEDEAELQIRNDLIRQIRALERAPKNEFYVRTFDPTESSGIGLLNEMSLVELQERLRLNKIHEQEKEEAAREKYRQQKVEKAAELRRKMENVSEIRAYAKKANAERRVRSAMTAEEQAKQQAQEAEARNKTLVSRLRGMRTRRQREQDKLDAECEAVAKARLLLGAGRDQMERKFHRDKQDGLEREARLRQQLAKHDQSLHEQKKTAARTQAIANKRAEERKAREAERRRAEQVDAASRYMADKAFNEKKEKQEHFRSTRERKAALLDARDRRNRYEAEARKKSVARSRKFVARNAGGY
eukprot:INCI462.1.p1 GENE.INCI462.1~~INCI462.1.p1  ORF type:complete len:694 (+),score=177.81 INCI462.1:472-2553(+)